MTPTANGRSSPFSTTRAMALVTLLTLPGFGRAALALDQQTSGLHIVVIEGEDAVNIIQQKSAVAPVVEVRDRNDQPVAGAIVNFAIRSGRATFGGARTVSIATNAAGRAVAAGLAPTGSGALQISATAAFQGQTAAAVTIAQTNVMTAAQAAAVSGASAGGAGGSSGGASAGTSAGAGGGGGLSGTTIGIVGAAAAGSVVAVKELGLIGGGKTYTGQFSGTLPMTFGTGAGACTRNEQQRGTLELKLTDENGAISGTAKIANGEVTITPGTCNPTTPANSGTDSFGMPDAPVSGTAGSISFTGSASNQFPASASGPAGTNSYQYSFAGTLSDGQVTGSLVLHREIGGPIGTAGNGTGTVTYAVTLR